MKKHKFFCLLLAMTLTWGTVLSCSRESTQTDTTSRTDTADSTETPPAETEDPAVTDDLPSGLDFGGAAFRMYSPDAYTGESLTSEMTGEVLNDTKYDMEIATEERLNVEISETPASYWDMPAMVQSLILSGDTTYSCITLMDRFALQCAMAGCFLPMQELEYLDLSKRYWGEHLSQALTIGNNNYFAVGSFNLRAFGGTSVVFFNSKLAADNGIEIPFAAVEEGKWTLDMLESYQGMVSVDLDGDGDRDADDQFTYGSDNLRNVPMQLSIGSDVYVVEKDENDIPYIAVYGSEKYIDIMERLRALFFNGVDCLSTDLATADTSEIFRNDRELISFGKFDSILQYREMESDFSILPVPKYDETQQNYICRTYDSMFSMVPVTALDTAMAGAVLEALSAYGYKNLIPAFIESSLQEKYARDINSVRCIQLAFDSRAIDMGEAFLYTYFGNDAMYTLAAAPSLTIASHLESIRAAVDKELSGITEKLLSDVE